MSVVVVGLEHHVAPLELLERVTVGEADLAKVLASLRDQVNLEESVLLSTCLRTEVYAVVDRFHDAVSEVEELIATTAGLSVDDLRPHLSIRFDDEVPNHLFSVAAGLESAVVGESEVLGQVRRAWERAQQERVSGPVLAALFRHALRTGKRVRSETGIARGTTSFAHAAVERARRASHGGLGGVRAVVVGAGSMGEGVFGALLSRPHSDRPSEVVVVNRSIERAEKVVRAATTEVPVRAAGMVELARVVAGADAVIVALAAGHAVGPADLAPSGTRQDRPLVVVDLGMPRTVDPAARSVPGLALFDMDDLRVSVEEAVEGRRGELEAARAIVGQEVEQYRLDSRARGAAPVVSALRARLEEWRVAELDRRRGRFGTLGDSDWAEVDAATRAVLAKLVHEPTLLLKETAGTPRGERLVEALRILFDL